MDLLERGKRHAGCRGEEEEGTHRPHSKMRVERARWEKVNCIQGGTGCMCGRREMRKVDECGMEKFDTLNSIHTLVGRKQSLS